MPNNVIPPRFTVREDKHGYKLIEQWGDHKPIEHPSFSALAGAVTFALSIMYGYESTMNFQRPAKIRLLDGSLLWVTNGEISNWVQHRDQIARSQ